MAFFEKINGFIGAVVFRYRLHIDSRKHVVGYLQFIQSRTQGQAVYDSGQHTHLIAFDTVESTLGTAQTPENISTAYHYAHLYAHDLQLFDLFGIFVEALGIYPVVAFPHQGLSTEFQ
ncbi:MAG: hypothetical protein BWX77_00555 [Bacteroidetes bacterium ADurb.Bin090]|nr:MAG: hypothetical protein BWX77_00555 [Bacteroidetes bacterium ADurb.Bin090]